MSVFAILNVFQVVVDFELRSVGLKLAGRLECRGLGNVALQKTVMSQSCDLLYSRLVPKVGGVIFAVKYLIFIHSLVIE